MIQRPTEQQRNWDTNKKNQRSNVIEFYAKPGEIIIKTGAAMNLLNSA